MSPSHHPRHNNRQNRTFSPAPPQSQPSRTLQFILPKNSHFRTENVLKAYIQHCIIGTDEEVVESVTVHHREVHLVALVRFTNSTPAELVWESRMDHTNVITQIEWYTGAVSHGASGRSVQTNGIGGRQSQNSRGNSNPNQFAAEIFCTGEMQDQDDITQFASFSMPLQHARVSIGTELHVHFSAPPPPCSYVRSIALAPESVECVHLCRSVRLVQSAESSSPLDAIIFECSSNAALKDEKGKRTAIDSTQRHMFEVPCYALFFATSSIATESAPIDAVGAWCIKWGVKRVNHNDQQPFTCLYIGKRDRLPDARYHFESLDSFASIADMDTQYAIYYLLTNRIVSSNQFTNDFFELLSEVHVGDRHDFLYHRLTTRTRNLCNSLLEYKGFLLQKHLGHSTNPNSALYQPMQDTYDNRLYFLLRHVVITPTAHIVMPPQMERACPISAQYENMHHHFLRIQFVDEHLEDNYFNGSRWRERAVSFLKNGFKFGSMRYQFLGFGSSQLKKHSAMMFHESAITIEDVYQSIGELRSISHLPKFVARLGQAFSSTETSIRLPESTVGRVIDVTRTHKGITYTFTDGCGRMHADLMHQLHTEAKLEVQHPSAVQIRYGGCKGMLVYHPGVPNGLAMEIRPSQEKFPSNHLVLYICGYSDYKRGNLNRQFINLLHDRGVPAKVFEQMQEKMLNGLDSVRGDARRSENFLQKYKGGPLKEVLLAALKAGIPNTEPFLHQCLSALTRSQLSQLQKKAKICIPDPPPNSPHQRYSALLYGVPDEFGVLKEGEVFIQYQTEEFSESITVQGDVFVMKSPTHHPGDLRRLKAVNCKELQHLRNVIVFNIQGDRPVADMIAKGDLDGDVYFCVWHPDFLEFGAKKNHAPFEYEHPSASSHGGQITEEMLIQYFAEKLSTNMLGRLCNKHLRVVDQYGLRSTEAISLVGAIQKALDEAKTGIAPEMPKISLRVHPVYLMQEHDPKMRNMKWDIQQGDSVLTRLFKRVMAFKKSYKSEHRSAHAQVGTTMELLKSPIDITLFQHESILVQSLLGEYKAELQYIMTRHSIQEEGSALTFTFGVKRTDNRDVIVEQIKTLISQMRSSFEALVKQGEKNHPRMEQHIRHILLYLCFHCTYDTNLNPAEQFEIVEVVFGRKTRKSVKQQFLGLPWVLMDHGMRDLQGIRKRE